MSNALCSHGIALAFLVTLVAPGVAHARTATPLQGQLGSFLEIQGSKIYYEECGSGPAIVLLHDGLISSATWDEVWGPLCAKFHVLRYDRRGYGRSDSPKLQFSPTDDLYALLRHANIGHAVIVGNSSGGALAIDFALEHPRMVDGLFLIGPVVHGSLRDSAYFIERGEKNNAPLARDNIQATAENWSKDRFLLAEGHDTARKKFYNALMQYPQSLRYPGNLEIRPAPPAGTRLAEIQAPTLVFAGEYDIADVHAYCGAIENGIPDVARGVIKDAGHMIQLEKPQEIADRLARFVERATRKMVSVTAPILETYAGQYKLNGTTLTVVPKDGRLIVRIPNLRDLPFFPQAESRFFMKTREIEISFETDSTGKITQAVFYQAGTATNCPRA
jgi:pimeloyl-ACP methyl ester carboxylesterase